MMIWNEIEMKETLEQLDAMAELLLSGEWKEFEWLGMDFSVKGEVSDGKISLFNLGGGGTGYATMYPKPVSGRRAAVGVIKMIVDENPSHVFEHDMFYSFMETPEGQEIWPRDDPTTKN